MDEFTDETSEHSFLTRQALALANLAGRFFGEQGNPDDNGLERAHRLGEYDTDKARPEWLADLAVLAGGVQLEILFTVSRLRRAGYSWQVIGEALGVSRQAAQQRYGGRALHQALLATHGVPEHDGEWRPATS